MASLRRMIIDGRIDGRIRKSDGIDYIDITVRTYNCLRKAGFKTVDEVAAKTEEELLRLKGFGRTCLEEIRLILQSQDLSLGMGPPPQPPKRTPPIFFRSKLLDKTEGRKRIEKRREDVGMLLLEMDTYSEIACKLGVSEQCVKNIEKRYFSKIAKIAVRRQQKEHREVFGRLLRETDLSLADIARKTGVTRERIRQIQVKYYPEFSRRRRR